MSEAAVEDSRPSIELPDRGDAAFGALMDALAPEGEAEKGAGTEGAPAVRPADGAAAGAAAETGGDGAPAAAAGTGTDGAGAGKAGPSADVGDGKADVAPAGGGGEPAQPSGGGAAEPAPAGGAAAPAEWTASPTDVTPKLAELNAKLEENVLKAHQQRAFNAVKEEHGKYFEALEKHPRLLVGTKVPAIGKEGTETLRSSEDAKEWQEAVKSILVQEIDARAQTGMDESRTFLETVHASIDLFKNNTDLIPGTKGFDKELADKFAGFAKPYEVRVDGKLQGYSIPVQPLIDSLRQQKAAQPSTTLNSSQQSTKTEAPPADPPQASIPSKAASSAEKEDFSTLFGTIGLPFLKI